jgi:hypothetical protein
MMPLFSIRSMRLYVQKLYTNKRIKGLNKQINILLQNMSNSLMKKRLVSIPFYYNDKLGKRSASGRKYIGKK